MKVKRIHELLVEASLEETSNTRLVEIQCIFQHATSNFNGDKYLNGATEGITMVLSCLYNETLDSRRDLLPSLLPVFVLMCGDRGKPLLANINWEEINKIL